MLKIISGSKKCPRTHLDFSAVKAWFPWVCWGGFSFLACLCKRQKKSAVHFPDKTPSSVCYRMNAGWDSTWNHISFSFSSTQIQFTLLLQERISERSWAPEETQFFAKCFPQEGFCSSPQRHCLWSDLAEFSGEPLDRRQDYGSTERGQGHTLEQRAPGGVRLGTHLWDLGPDGCASVWIPCCLLVWSLSLPCTELNDSRATNYYYYPYYCCCYCCVYQTLGFVNAKESLYQWITFTALVSLRKALNFWLFGFSLLSVGMGLYHQTWQGIHSETSKEGLFIVEILEERGHQGPLRSTPRIHMLEEENWFL